MATYLDLGFFIVGGALFYVLVREFFTHREAMSQQRAKTAPDQEAPKKMTDEFFNNLPTMIANQEKIYKEQVAASAKLTPEEREKILKPIKDQIDLLNNLKQYQGIVRPAGHAIEKIFGDFGKMFE